MARSGTANVNARLDMEKARAIRASSDNDTELAEQYGVSRETIRQIRLGRTWREDSTVPRPSPRSPHRLRELA